MSSPMRLFECAGNCGYRPKSCFSPYISLHLLDQASRQFPLEEWYGLLNLLDCYCSTTRTIPEISRVLFQVPIGTRLVSRSVKWCPVLPVLQPPQINPLRSPYSVPSVSLSRQCQFDLTWPVPGSSLTDSPLHLEYNSPSVYLVLSPTS
jgi:hypothetical protein